MALQQELERQGNRLFRYRGWWPLVILCAGVAVYCYVSLHPEYFLLGDISRTGWYRAVCLAIGLAGLAVRCYTVGYTPAGTSGRNTTQGQIAERVNTTGIYSVVRHPLYLGNFLMWLGVALLTGSEWFVLSFCLAFWLYYERIMFAEEQFLERKFGQFYREWADRTPAFYPRMGLFVRPTLPFSWKKVLKKEKNGLVSLLCVFFGFDVLGQVITGGNDYSLPLGIACAASVVLYFVLKYLKRRTHVLDEEGR